MRTAEKERRGPLLANESSAHASKRVHLLISADEDATHQQLCLVYRFTPGPAKNPRKHQAAGREGGESLLQKCAPKSADNV